ncbi:MAG: invasion associated locus B family protein [Pseudomonadota bacterium]
MTLLSLSRPVPKVLSGAAFFALVAAATPSFAQEGGETEAPGQALELDMGSPADGVSDGIGEPYVLDVSGDWQISCIRTELEHDPCGMVQLLEDQSGNPVARIRLVNIPGGGQAAAGANVVTPLETLLSREISLSVDGSSERLYGFTYCTPASCVANVGFTEAEVDQFRRGNAAQITIFALQAPDVPVRLEMSLSGFTAGYTRVTELNALNAEAVAEARAAAEQETTGGE